MEFVSKETGKLRRPMTAKCWTLVLVGTMAFVMVLIAVVNYIVDPFSYFHRSVAEDRGIYSFDSNTHNYRLANFRYFKAHHQEYSGVILGGSKFMFLGESCLIDGERYCNLGASYGNFYDNLEWVQWIAGNTDIRQIIIGLSTLEVEWYTPEERNEETSGYILPAELDRNKSSIIQFIQYLYRGGIEPSLQYLKSEKNGSLVWINYTTMLLYAISKNPDSYCERWMSNLNERLERSVNGDQNSMPAIIHNLEALQEIRRICEESGIQLSVVIGPTSTIQYLQYESPEYWDYLRGIAQIVDYWDFSMPSVINNNMYNFRDADHAQPKVLNYMLDQIYGTETDHNFGVYVTAENAEEYIAERQRRYYALMEEYAETGTVRQGIYFDEGYLLNDMFYPVISNTENAWVANIPFKDHLSVAQHFYASFDHLEGIGVFPERLSSNPENLGNLKLRIYDDTARHTIFSGDVDLTGIWYNGLEFFIPLNGLELTEGHWYSLVFSYEPKFEDDFFSFQCVDGESTGNLYMELDGVWQGYEIKMDLFRSQTYGNYRQRDAVLQTDQMRGEGEGETLELTGQTRYTQTFTADCDLLSYIQLRTSHLSDPEEQGPVDEAYSIILELRGPDGTLMSRKTIMGAVLQNADVYNVTFDEDLYLEPGKTYELTLYANKTTGQGLKLLTHGEEPGSALYLNGVKTGESLCYRIYGVSGAEIEYRRANVHG